MIILGIDPGVATTGYGLLSVKKNNYDVVSFGLIETSKETIPSKRLLSIYRQLTEDIISSFKPDVMAIEKLFFATNAKTAIRVGQAQGVILHSAASFNLDVYEYAPGTIKKIISGDGRADKKKMQRHLRKLLGNGVRSKPNKKTHFDNSADALAVALCHAYKVNGIKY